MKKILIIIASLIPLICSAQQAKYVDFFPEGDNVVITYHLTDDASTITVFLSENGGDWKDLKQVSGDVGENVPAGDKSIVWNVFKEKPTGVTDDVRIAVIPNYKDPSIDNLPEDFPQYNTVIRGNKAYGAKQKNYSKKYAGDIRKGTWASATDNISFDMVVYEYDFITGETTLIGYYPWQGRVSRKEPSGDAARVSFPVVKIPDFSMSIDKKGRVYLGNSLILDE